LLLERKNLAVFFELRMSEIKMPRHRQYVMTAPRFQGSMWGIIVGQAGTSPQLQYLCTQYQQQLHRHSLTFISTHPKIAVMTPEEHLALGKINPELEQVRCPSLASNTS
jgi:hypothetical protein